MLLCEVQVLQHFEKITLLLYNKVLKLGKPVSINTQWRRSHWARGVRAPHFYE